MVNRALQCATKEHILVVTKWLLPYIQTYIASIVALFSHRNIKSLEKNLWRTWIKYGHLQSMKDLFQLPSCWALAFLLTSKRYVIFGLKVYAFPSFTAGVETRYRVLNEALSKYVALTAFFRMVLEQKPCTK